MNGAICLYDPFKRKPNKYHMSKRIGLINIWINWGKLNNLWVTLIIQTYYFLQYWIANCLGQVTNELELIRVARLWARKHKVSVKRPFLRIDNFLLWLKQHIVSIWLKTAQHIVLVCLWSLQYEVQKPNGRWPGQCHIQSQNQVLKVMSRDLRE